MDLTEQLQDLYRDIRANAALTPALLSRRVSRVHWPRYNALQASREKIDRSMEVLNFLWFLSDNAPLMRKVLRAAMDNGYCPYNDEALWDVMNLHFNRRLTAALVQELATRNLCDSQGNSVLHVICGNYLVLPTVLKMALKHPSVHACVNTPNSDGIVPLQQVWEGETTNDTDVEDLLCAHHALVAVGAQANPTVVALMREQLYDVNERLAARGEQALFQAQAIYEKQQLTAALGEVHPVPTVRKKL